MTGFVSQYGRNIVAQKHLQQEWRDSQSFMIHPLPGNQI